MKFDENSKELLEKIENLPNLDANLDFGDVVRIFNQSADTEFKKQIYDLARDLRPWRKGPFEIFITFIDSEWQSQIKFNLLKPHLNLRDKVVCDVGCNNGYYMFRMSGLSPKKLVGFDPSVRTFLQFKFLNKFAKTGIIYELLGVEDLPNY